MDKPKFVYVTYISTTPEKLWNALMDSEMTKQYWDANNVSDWRVGSKWEHQDATSGSLRIVGRIVEVKRPERLVLTWADPAEEARKDMYSRVTFEIKPLADTVRLTVIHEELEPGSEMLQSISQGWPKVISSLKTLLETGESLPIRALFAHA